MSKRKSRKRVVEQKVREAKYALRLAGRTPPPPIPFERGDLTPEIESQLQTTNNVKDVPLQMLRIHTCHGDRNPYLDSPEGLARRQLCESHIRDAKGWDSLACEVLTISVHKDGSYWIIDGVGRLYMGDVLSGGVVRVLPCRLLYGLTPAQELALFKRLGTQRKKVTPYDVWRASGSADVKPIIALKSKFGYNMPRVQLPTLRFAQEQTLPKSSTPVLERAVAIVSGTSLGANRKYTTIMSGAVAAILASQPNFDEARFRDVIPDDSDFSFRLFDKAQRKTSRLGYIKPHTRQVTWQAAIILIEDYYNPNLSRDRKLDASALDEIKTQYADAYSTADPTTGRKKAA